MKTNSRKHPVAQSEIEDSSILQEIAALRRDECDRIPIKDFTAIDRRKVLNEFLLKEDVFTMLYDKIFPSNTQTDAINYSVNHGSSASRLVTRLPDFEEDG
mmetsp:Transcript_3645/g.4566  ORF Transcript_3645/g.4566 Transcript_3645/m.4566 type:complete len:101 (-) Transcript_3645:1117-1419(-)